MNRIVIIGRLCNDPELKTTNSNIAVCSFRVAVNRRFNKEETDFFPVTAWRDAATNCSKYLHKGDRVAVSGALQIRNYEQDGVKKIAVDIQADEVEYLQNRDERQADNVPQQRKATPKVAELEEIDYGAMPF